MLSQCVLVNDFPWPVEQSVYHLNLITGYERSSYYVVSTESVNSL